MERMENIVYKKLSYGDKKCFLSLYQKQEHRQAERQKTVEYKRKKIFEKTQITVDKNKIIVYNIVKSIPKGAILWTRTKSSQKH